MNITDEIQRLHQLHQAGALTDAEFAQAKAKLLHNIELNKPADSGIGGNGGSNSGSNYNGPAADLVEEFGRLRRARGDRWLGGVCGGLGKISGMASWIWRVVFALFTLSFGFGAVIYILLWIFVPDEESRTL